MADFAVRLIINIYEAKDKAEAEALAINMVDFGCQHGAYVDGVEHDGGIDFHISDIERTDDGS